jgi:hypothetical protein
MLALVVLPVAALWAFAVPRVTVGWAALGGGGVLLIAASQFAGMVGP